MTIDEAIRRLDDFLLEHRSHITFDRVEALALGIEALKGIKQGRIRGVDFPFQPLPGETKEP